MIALLFAFAAPAWAETPQFTDWTAATTTGASGTLLGAPATLKGHLQAIPGTNVDGGWQAFNRPFFTPPLAQSDVLATFLEGPGPVAYAVHFGAPVRDPVFHLGSFGSVFAFPSGTAVELVSSQQDPDRRLHVAGSTVTGDVNGVRDGNGDTDGNGTIRLRGTFQDITWVADLAEAGEVRDGHEIQIAGLPPLAPPPPPPPPPVLTPQSGVRTVTAPTSGVRQLVLRTKGLFRTVGARSAAKGRSAAWVTRDRCDGTQTKVRHGRVSVRTAKRTVKLRAGQSYLAKARLFGLKKRRG